MPYRSFVIHSLHENSVINWQRLTYATSFKTLQSQLEVFNGLAGRVEFRSPRLLFGSTSVCSSNICTNFCTLPILMNLNFLSCLMKEGTSVDWSSKAYSKPKLSSVVIKAMDVFLPVGDWEVVCAKRTGDPEGLGVNSEKFVWFFGLFAGEFVRVLVSATRIEPDEKPGSSILARSRLELSS
ncbi:hypothetical protein CLUG_03134 [Clavispora lusitaniae ATCC 42720]|uniref:Uncharacterized protein n=1 Tax=Clavispora lusitaniae (strain ATCC 42720) TaxID=306902 RepID=C4Y3M1_CLAL4|nr:uncharacterized protein CLUG_03134 [Clavispora lusitaniae ATCC 42720]EEQ39008.1 hypothetical protein CLUG_03134 [Clavispora lusitaniae ATCC 42720]